MLALVLSTLLTTVPANGPMGGSVTAQPAMSANVPDRAMLAEPRNDTQDSMQGEAQGDSTDSNQQQLGH